MNDRRTYEAMLCPNCAGRLQERTREGVQIDVCPECRGIWLDRGELDRLLDNISKQDDDRYYEPSYKRSGHHKKRSRFDFLRELFD